MFTHHLSRARRVAEKASFGDLRFKLVESLGFFCDQRGKVHKVKKETVTRGIVRITVLKIRIK